MPVSLRLDENIEDLAFGVDGAPEIDHPATDFQIDFVQMPDRMRPRATLAQVGCDDGPGMKRRIVSWETTISRSAS